MPKFLEMKYKDTTILVEVADEEKGIRKISKEREVIKKLDKLFDDVVKNEIINQCKILNETFNQLKKDNTAPTTATVELGLQFSGEGNIYLVKSAVQANYKIKMQWKL